VYGALRPIDDHSHLLDIVRRTVAVYERNMPRPWSVDSADATFIDKLLAAIVGFEIDIDRLEGKWKLSQNHDADRRARVVQALRAQGDTDGQQIAALMADPGAAAL
jgi:transcriptional regulator